MLVPDPALPDPFDLSRFIRAQDRCYGTARDELQAGAKRSHWMWFMFPQIAGLGHSDAARYYAIASLAEARAYLDHPLLGPRLIDCLATLAASPARSAEAALGPTDAMKLRSSLTLFEQAGGESVFGEAIDRWFAGQRDAATLHRTR